MSVEATERAAALWSDESDWDFVLRALRAEGFSKADCVRASAELLHLPLADAKVLVHDGAVWRDVRDRDNRFHEELIAEVDAKSAPRRG